MMRDDEMMELRGQRVTKGTKRTVGTMRVTGMVGTNEGCEWEVTTVVMMR